MTTQWCRVRFDRLAEQVRDTVQPSAAIGMPYVALEHIGEGTLHLTGVGRAEDATSTKSRFRRGDILFGKLRPYFRKVVRAPFDGVCSTDIWVVRPRSGVDPVYLFYLMASDLFVEPVVRASEGTKMPRAKWDYAAALEVPLPPLHEQRAIAHILGTLDDKIELNRRMARTLEEMARALFKAWFVDFEPVRAKMDGRWRRGESLPGLPAHLYDLFPDRLVDSELGPIPEGWGVAPLSQVCTQVRTQVHPQTEPDTVFLHYSIPAYDAGRQPMSELGRAIKSSKFAVVPGSVLLSKLNPEIERVWIPDVIPGSRAICSTEFMVLEPTQPFGRAWLYSILVQPAFREAIRSLVTGTSKSHQRAQPQAVMSTSVVVPPKQIAQSFENHAGPWLSRVLVLQRESATACAIRNGLLPGLVSGALRVRQAE